MLLGVKCGVDVCSALNCSWLPCLQEGKEFDALVVDVMAVGSPLDVFESDTLEVCAVCICRCVYACTYTCMCVGVCRRMCLHQVLCDNIKVAYEPKSSSGILPV